MPKFLLPLLNNNMFTFSNEAIATDLIPAPRLTEENEVLGPIIRKRPKKQRKAMTGTKSAKRLRDPKPTCPYLLEPPAAFEKELPQLQTEEIPTTTHTHENRQHDGDQELATPRINDLAMLMKRCESIYDLSHLSLPDLDDEEIICLVEDKTVPAYELEKRLGNPERAVRLRRTLVSMFFPTPELKAKKIDSFYPQHELLEWAKRRP